MRFRIFFMFIIILSILSCSDFLTKHEKVIQVSAKHDFELTADELKQYKIEAGKENGVAAFRIYLYYRYYLHDQENALEWREKAANSGYSKAQYSLAIDYLSIPKMRNKERALYWFRKAAAQGVVEAKRYVELFLSTEDKNVLMKKAEVGDSDAAFELYESYYLIEDDEYNAKYWLQKAAENGNSKAKLLLE